MRRLLEGREFESEEEPAYLKGKRAQRMLSRALETNPYVPAYLLGARPLPDEMPDLFALGSEEEAVIYVGDLRCLLAPRGGGGSVAGGHRGRKAGGVGGENGAVRAGTLPVGRAPRVNSRPVPRRETMETRVRAAHGDGTSGEAGSEMTGHLLYVITSGDTGGAQSHVLHCCTRLRNEYGVGLVAGTGGYLVERARALGLPVYVLPGLGRNRPAAGDVAVLRGLLRVIRDFRPALVCCHSTKAGFLGRLAARLAGVPAVFTVHGWGFSEGVPALRRAAVLRAERLAAGWADRIICVSEYDRDLALRHGVARPEQMVVVPNGVPPVGEELRARPGEGGPVRLVMVARFEAPKDHLLLLRALAGLAAPEWELWLVGDGRLEEKARQEAAGLGLGDRVRFLGPRHEVPELLARCHVFVLTSNWEGLPLTVLEAMRAGLPVVASDVGGVREAVADGETGFLVPRGDAARLRERLKLLLQTPELRARMGAAGYGRWRERFTLDRMLRNTEAVYREVLRRAGWRRPA